MKLIILFLFIPSLLTAQLIDNRKCAAFSSEPFFYTSFIQKNKIKSITGAVSTKGDLQVIKSKGLVTKYEFDSTGLLFKQYDSFMRGNKKDTSIITYHYDILGNMITKRMSDSYGFFSYNFKHNEQQDVIQKTYCRDENATGNKNNFKLQKQYTIVNESYSYIRTDSTLQKNVFNNHGSVYQKEYYTYDENNLLSKKLKKLIVNHKKAETTYKYNDLGKVSEKRVQKDLSKTAYTRFVYKYDEFGNLEEINEYVNEKMKTHKEVIYNKSTFLMKALLVQDVNSNFITITKFTYEFWE